jgi:hypothetical protein
MDLDNMIFPTGSTFISGSWIYETDDKGKLQGHLLEDQENLEDFALLARSTEELTGELSRLAMSESSQVSPMIEFSSDSGTKSALETNLDSFHGKPDSFSMGLRNTASIHQEINSSLLQNSSIKLGPFPFRLNNMAKSCQILLQEATRSVRRVPLAGAQEGLVLTITLQDCLIHWPGFVSRDGDIRLVDEATILPYQEGSTLYNTDTSTEIISNSNGAVTDAEATHAREVFMIRRPPLIPPKAPDVRSSDESESNISPNALEYDGKTESQKRARERKNKLKESRRCRVSHSN